jgi:hypothetical protein
LVVSNSYVEARFSLAFLRVIARTHNLQKLAPQTRQFSLCRRETPVLQKWAAAGQAPPPSIPDKWVLA